MNTKSPNHQGLVIGKASPYKDKIKITLDKDKTLSQNDAIRFRVISNSNSSRDIFMKEMVVNKISGYVFNDYEDKEVTRKNIISNISKIDRENLYYYYKDGVYAIFDLKNAKLYYFENSIWNEHKDYSNILGVETKNYNTREIYSVRGGPQNDGLDYYVYEFSKECGQDIIRNLDNNSEWSSDRLDDKILNNFIYNEEVLEIKSGYYHYELVCRTSDENKKKNITEENATGCEIGVYDVDKNILYYYWQSI